MAAIMWRMNGLWRRTAGFLILWVLLLSNEVMCQEGDTTVATGVTGASANVPASTRSDASDDAASDDATSDDAVSGITIGVTGVQTNQPKTTFPTPIQADNQINKILSNNDFLEQEENKASNSEEASPESSSASSGSSVFIGILVTGVLAALAITIGYFKCQRRSEPKGEKLAEEAYPADQENQGNTLVSVAPLNPPPETQEKPNINGESTEPAKTEPPAPPAPNNGHSTVKTADTEL